MAVKYLLKSGIHTEIYLTRKDGSEIKVLSGGVIKYEKEIDIPKVKDNNFEYIRIRKYVIENNKKRYLYSIDSEVKKYEWVYKYGSEDIRKFIKGFDDGIVSEDSPINLDYRIVINKGHLSFKFKTKVELCDLNGDKYSTTDFNEITLLENYNGIPSIDVAVINNCMIITTGREIFVVKIFEDLSNKKGTAITIEPLYSHAKMISTTEAVNLGYNIASMNPKSYVENKFNNGSKNMISGILFDDLSFDVNKKLSGHIVVDLINDYKDLSLWTFSIVVKTYDKDGKLQDTKDVHDKDLNITVKQEVDSVKFKIDNYLPIGEYQIHATGKKANEKDIEKLFVLNVTRSSELSIKHKNYELYNEMSKCKGVKSMFGKLVLYGNGTKQIYPSNINDIFYFSASNIAIADVYNKSEEVLSIMPYKDYNLIFTKSTIMSMQGRGDVAANMPFKILPLDGEVGITNKDAITKIENTIAFVSNNGIYVIDQITVSEHRMSLVNVSAIVGDLASPVKLSANGEEDVYRDVFAINSEQRIVFMYPSKNLTLVYDYSSGLKKAKWFTWDSPKHGTPHKAWIVGKDRKVIFDMYEMEKTKICEKNKKLMYESRNGKYPKHHYSDGVEDIEVTIKTKNNTAGSGYDKAIVKEVKTTVENTVDKSPVYSVEIDADGYSVDKYIVNKHKFDSPNLKKGFKLGRQLTTYRELNNVNTHIIFKSKEGRGFSVKIQNKDKLPFVLRNLTIIYVNTKKR